MSGLILLPTDQRTFVLVNVLPAENLSAVIEATKRMQAHLAEQVKPQPPVIVPIIINPGINTVRK